ISNAEPKPADPEKLKLEKSIIRLEKEIKKAVKDYNIIDFGQAENNKLHAFKKKIQEICKKTENLFGREFRGDSPIVWLKNIDKITDSELKKELLKVVDPSQNTNLGKLEKPIDLSQFTLVATTSKNSPQTVE
ncbi:8585_t:CDS:2, partial [Ambispora leptoticha]